MALYVKQDLACKFLSCKSLVVDDLFECCSIEILVSGHRNIIVSCIYRCPGSNIDTFSEHIVQLFVELTIRKTVFLCGDFNIDILKQGRRRRGRQGRAGQGRAGGDEGGQG